MSLDNIFAKKVFVEGIGNIYPIKIKDYDEFFECADILYISKKMFEDIELSLFDIIFAYLLKNENEEERLTFKEIEMKFNNLLYYTLNTNRVDFLYQEDGITIQYYIIDKDKDEKEIVYQLNKNNYDVFREVVMRQNLMFEPKIFKNPLVQKWADKIIKTRAKNSIDITMEDKIDTVHVFTGITYSELEKETIYQIEKDFQRVMKLKGYDTDVNFVCAGDEKRNITHFAEKIDINKSPYDDLFVDKSKLNKLNDAMK